MVQSADAALGLTIRIGAVLVEVVGNEKLYFVVETKGKRMGGTIVRHKEWGEDSSAAERHFRPCCATGDGPLPANIKATSR